MRDFIGKWRVAQMLWYNEKKEDFEWLSVEDFLAKPDIDPDYIHASKTLMEFDESKINMLVPIPEGATQEEIDEAVKSGEIQLKDGMMFAECYDWKIEDGKAYFDTQEEGEVLDEQVSPWREIEEIGDMIEIMTFRFVKI